MESVEGEPHPRPRQRPLRDEDLTGTADRDTVCLARRHIRRWRKLAAVGQEQDHLRGERSDLYLRQHRVTQDHQSVLHRAGRVTASLHTTPRGHVWVQSL